MSQLSLLPFLRGLCCLLMLLLASCQSDPRPAAPGITADNYLTAIPDPKTLGETYVSDPDTLLDGATVAALNARLDSLDQAGRAHIDVVLVRSVGEAVPKTVAHKLFRKWKIGTAADNNGLLLLLVADQRRIEMETGYGLEGDLPDVVCYRIQQRYMVPALREGQLDQAVAQGVAALIRELLPPGAAALSDSASLQARIDSLVYGADARQLEQLGNLADEPAGTVEIQTVDAPPVEEPGPSSIGVLVTAALMLVPYLWLGYCTTRGRRGRGWWLLVPAGLLLTLVVLALGYWWPASAWLFAGLCYGLLGIYMHGYFLWLYLRERHPAANRAQQYRRLVRLHDELGLAPVLFPVGLALYWQWYQRRLHHLRHDAYTCPECRQPMQRAESSTVPKLLMPGQQMEHKLESVAYDVWQCPAAHRLVLGYPNPEKEIRVCPACYHRTVTTPRVRPVERATTQKAGWGWEISKCRFCQHEEKKKKTIPRLPDPSSRSSSAAGSSSSSWSSSSSSSGSSRSTSSGGSSGGGGAGSSW